jgi:hypothetical protein
MNVWLLYYGLHVRAGGQIVNDLIATEYAELEVFSGLTTIKVTPKGMFSLEA